MSCCLTSAQKRRAYRIDKIIGRRFLNNRPQLLIKWRGLTAAHNSWEPLGKIHCREKINQFLKAPARILSVVPTLNNDLMFHIRTKGNDTIDMPAQSIFEQCPLLTLKHLEAMITLNFGPYERDNVLRGIQISYITHTNDYQFQVDKDYLELDYIYGAGVSVNGMTLCVKWHFIQEFDLIYVEDAYERFPKHVFSFFKAKLLEVFHIQARIIRQQIRSTHMN